MPALMSIGGRGAPDTILANIGHVNLTFGGTNTLSKFSSSGLTRPPMLEYPGRVVFPNSTI
jgi:hypothetical protein